MIPTPSHFNFSHYAPSCQEGGPPLLLAERFALTPLVPKTKQPVLRRWQLRRPLKPSEVAQWLSRGYGIGLRLGRQPSGEYIIALDIDSASGRDWLFRQGGVPVCPTIFSERGHKYVLKLPDGLTLGKLNPCRGVEILGEGHQIVLPSPAAPDDRYWVISTEELGFEIPEPHPWLIELIRACKRAPKRTRASKRPPVGKFETRPKAGEAKLGQALTFFTQNILPYARGTDSNKPKLLAAAILAHRVDGYCGAALVEALRAFQKKLPAAERVADSQVHAVARCTEREKYGFNAAVYSERTETPYPIAKSVYSLIKRFDREESRNIYMPRIEITRRIQRTIALRGQLIAPGLWILDAGTEELAKLAGVSPDTLKDRRERADTPLILVSTKQGAVTRWLFAWTPHTFKLLATWVNSLSIRDLGGERVLSQSLGEERFRCYEARAGP